MWIIDQVQTDGKIYLGLRNYRDKITLPIIKLLVNLHVTPNQLTWAGFSLGVLSLVFLLFNHYWWFVLLLTINSLADGFDGPLARYTNTASAAGDRLDHSLDMIMCVLAFITLTWFLHQPWWLIGISLLLLDLLLQYYLKSKPPIAGGRMTLLICSILNLPQVGLGLISLYAVGVGITLLGQIGRKGSD